MVKTENTKAGFLKRLVTLTKPSDIGKVRKKATTHTHTHKSDNSDIIWRR